MELNKFIQNFADQFEETPIEQLTPQTIYEDLEEWDSLIALSVIAMVDEEYEVGIGAKEIINSITIEGLFNTIMSKKD